ncbi:hypothetical protein [Rhodoplanes serenus]|uniref:hypothetical protein n=1 Tax=Rhodoplanes serenus TaxID=200615 RepID=UPI001478823B|nr:hypothetical protein [Rhodoplanes serenus]
MVRDGRRDGAAEIIDETVTADRRRRGNVADGQCTSVLRNFCEAEDFEQRLAEFAGESRDEPDPTRS